MHAHRSLLSVLLTLALSACAVAPVDEGELLHTPDMRIELPSGRSIEVGLALAGGGQKAAAFAMGVLAGLAETGALDEVDSISSVSGGSYAALYYYSREMENAGHPLANEALFADCIPLVDDRIATPAWTAGTQEGYCPLSDPWRSRWRPDRPDLANDPLRFASQTRAAQGLFMPGWTVTGTTDKGTRAKMYWRIAETLTATFALAAPHNITNSLFDWRIDYSFGKRRYIHGIARAYGATPAIMGTESCLSPRDAPPECSRQHGSAEQVESLTLADIRHLYELRHDAQCTGKCRLPLWIINATAGTSRTPLAFLDTGRYHAEDNAFEITPFGYGSGAYGFARWAHQDERGRSNQPSNRVLDAVGASAAFFDSQQRSTHRLLTPVVNAGQKLLNFEWGSWIPNYRLTRNEYRRAKAVHSALVWPLYLLHRHTANEDALNIRLSDGGMVENLGAWALLRRGVPNIIVVDAAVDDAYNFRDICSLHQQLATVGKENERKKIVFDDPALHRFTDLCPTTRGAQYKSGKDPFNTRRSLPSPVLTARVCALMAKTCDDSNTLSRLFVIKPAVNWEATVGDAPSLTVAVAAATAAIKAHQGPDLSHCLPDRAAKKNSRGYPCEVIRYLAYNPGQVDTYPQHSTVKMTTLSSERLYGAYRELARYYAKAIRIHHTDGKKQVTVDTSQFWVRH